MGDFIINGLILGAWLINMGIFVEQLREIPRTEHHQEAKTQR